MLTKLRTAEGDKKLSPKLMPKICAHILVQNNMNEHVERLKNMVLPKFTASPLKISTMCVTCKTCIIIDYKAFFEKITILPYYEHAEGCIKVKLLNAIKGFTNEDIKIASRKAKSTPASSKCRRLGGKNFLHQTTAVYRVKSGDDQWKEVNIKIFKNGSLQMSGVPSIEIAEKAQHLIMTDINRLNVGTSPLVPVPFDISLINSDFSVNFPINRDVLKNVLAKKYCLHAEFESTGYQGVKVSYMWNNDYYKDVATYPFQGTCYCDVKHGADRCLIGVSGSGTGKNECQCVTIAIFQTGRIIITGAKTMEQLYDVYDFMVRMLKDNMKEIYRRSIVLVPMTERKKNRTIHKSEANVPIADIELI